MSDTVRIGIVGYGNLGRGVEAALSKNPDLEAVAVFTRRPVDSLGTSTAIPVLPITALDSPRDDIDVLILCGGSKEDLPRQTPDLAARFCTVDSFDTHARIPEHFAAVDAAARAGQTTSIISCGWDPGMFSINRAFGEALLPDGDTYTFWGRGLSQGHSDAIRRVPGVAGGVQYTIPAQSAIDRVRSGERPVLSTREKHTRECFVVLAEGADPQAVTKAIVSMPHYFADYDTQVHLISADELARDHTSMPHGGFVIRSGSTSLGAAQVIEYGLTLDSNPEFTSSVLVAYARAAHRLNQQGQHGAKTVLDVAPGLLSPKSPETLRAELL